MAFMQERMCGLSRLTCEDNGARHSSGETKRMRAKQKPPKLTERGLRRLLQKSMKNYRDLTAAINGMWDKLHPRLLPGTMPAIGHPTADAAPAQLVERMTTAILNTLDIYERGRNVKTRQHGSAEGVNVR